MKRGEYKPEKHRVLFWFEDLHFEVHVVQYTKSDGHPPAHIKLMKETGFVVINPGPCLNLRPGEHLFRVQTLAYHCSVDGDTDHDFLKPITLYVEDSMKSTPGSMDLLTTCLVRYITKD